MYKAINANPLGTSSSGIVQFLMSALMEPAMTINRTTNRFKPVKIELKRVDSFTPIDNMAENIFKLINLN